MTLTAPSAHPRRVLSRRLAGRPGAGGEPSPLRRRWLPSWPASLLAAIAYLPLLLTAPGRVGVDTKAYLYIDPQRLISHAGIMWAPNIGMGAVTHQNIGFLLPQGAFFWLVDLVGLPAWVAQRLWTGSVLFLAGAGVLFCMRSFRWPNRPAFVAAVAYMLSPYVLEYEARMSAILLPYTGLGWLLGITVRGLREARGGRAAWLPDGWRWPAAFGVTVALVGSSNAASLIFVLLAPMLWLPFALWGTREVRLGPALGMIVRTGVLVVLCSAWWIAGLVTQAGYGVDILAYSETLKTVASASQASEVLRGLGNWYFYGEDALGTWITPSRDYTQTVWVVAVSFAVPMLALAGAALLRWGYKAYFVLLVLVGTTVAVGVYPYDNPSPLGAAFRAFAQASTAGFALRSMPRAVPLVALGLSVLLAGGLAAVSERLGTAVGSTVGSAVGTTVGTVSGRVRGRSGGTRRRDVRTRLPRLAPGTAWIVVIVLIVANLSPLWRGRFIESDLDRPEQIPAYERQVATALDATGPATRVLELPGADFAHYRWGTTLDPVLPGLTNRPYLVRELIPFSAAASADLLRAVDRRLQEGVFETSSLADMARLMGVGDIVLRSNQQYERFRTPRPVPTWALFTDPVPAGLGAPRRFGPPVTDAPRIPVNDELALGTPPDAVDPPALAVFGVTDPQPIVRTAATGAPLLVSGNGEGLVDAAAAGLLADPLTTNRAILYTASMAADPASVGQALSDGADLLLTDSNRRRAERWGSIRDNYGYVEGPDTVALAPDPNDNRLPVFPAETTAAQTVAVLHAPGQPGDIAAVGATSYGNAFSYSPPERPVGAVDGDLDTAWQVGAFANPAGQRLQIAVTDPVRTDRVRLVQPLRGSPNRWITKATLRFDGDAPVSVNLTAASRTEAGQLVTFPARRFTRLDITVEETNTGVRAQYADLSSVGFAEVDIVRPDGTSPHAHELLRMPTDLLTAAGTASVQHRLMLQVTRDRANPGEPFRSDAEAAMARVFTLPTARTFALTGTARASAYANDLILGTSTGRPSDTVTTESSGRLPGDLAAGSAGAFDGDPATLWSPGFGMQTDAWIQVNSPKPVSFSTLTLSVVADGRHSVPRTLGLVVDGKRVDTLTIPPITDMPGARIGQPGASRTVTLSFPPVRGSNIRLVVDDIRSVTTRDPISQQLITMPVGLAEVDIAGLRVPPATATLPGACRSDLLTLDGRPVPVRITGSSADALARKGLLVSLCGDPITLGPGDHVLRTIAGAGVGYDLDRLVLASEPGGGASPITAAGSVAPADQGTPVRSSGASTTRAPAVAVTGSSDTSFALRVTNAEPGTPFWLVLGQSLSAGWKATSRGTSTGGSTTTDYGAPRLVDGYANGWRITPTASSFTVDLRWTPQRLVRRALALSGIALTSCVVLMVVTARRRRRSRTQADPVTAELPRFASPTPRAPRVPVTVAVLAATVAALIAMALVNPAASIATGLATLAALLLPRGRTLLTLGPVAVLTLSATYVIQVQLRHSLPSDGEWVRAFARVATVSWIAVLLLGADVLVTAVQHRYRHDLTADLTADVTAGPSGPGTGAVTGGDAARPTVHP
ncbi:alpha-(1-_3)-arabinofuranosyltransferase domain-containing protein [Frankia sp. Cas4]|uniref:alpha-(1->3)-arabinofuranosyltransferase domain-containing protein n=3 Tax=Frankia TaxID=1854 RepID=UPI002AD591F2|nr:alpha-(1->3)-arabinofuranosyltransferase family protein [Frankia sp. Cas4]